MKWGEWKARFPRGSVVDGDGRRKHACAMFDDQGSGEPCPWVGAKVVEFRDGSKLRVCHGHANEIGTTIDRELLAAAARVGAESGVDPSRMLWALERLRRGPGIVRSE